jgi:hypothetical protein
VELELILTYTFIVDPKKSSPTDVLVKATSNLP